jgi:hypothetical protein
VRSLPSARRVSEDYVEVLEDHALE